MESSLKLQMDVRNNAEDLRRYMLDMANWEEDMKKKEAELKNMKIEDKNLPPPRNMIKRSSKKKGKVKKVEKPKKISAYDYSAWDKYNADKVCAEMDAESCESSSSSEEELETKPPEESPKSSVKLEEINKKDRGDVLKMVDEAFYEKELGNQFVRKAQWQDAINCYTKAIDLDPKNAAYYSNRSLCFLKLKNFKHSEVDATVAIQLDGTYVKAYMRRALARTALGQLREALLDYEKIIELEPNNAFAKTEFGKLEKKLKESEPKLDSSKTEKSIFNAKNLFNSEVIKKDEAEIKKQQPVKKTNTVEEKIPKVTDNKTEKTTVSEKTAFIKDVFGEVPEGFKIVKPVFIKPHLRSKKPLRRIPIKNVSSDSEACEELCNLSEKSSQSNTNITTAATVESVKPIVKDVDIPELINIIPQTFAEFSATWKLIKHNSTHALSYLKILHEKKVFRQVFKYDLDSDILSEILSQLHQNPSERCLAKSILYNISRLERFSLIRSFLSKEDQKVLDSFLDDN